MVENIFGKDVDDQDEVAAELVELNNEDEVVEEEDVEQTETFDDGEGSTDKPDEFVKKKFDELSRNEKFNFMMFI